MLEIHAAVERFHPETVDLYCAYLNEKLRCGNSSKVNDVIKANWKSVNTRGIAQVFITLQENLDIHPGSVENLLPQAITNVDVWTCIIGAEGTQRCLLEKQPMYSLMRNTYRKMYTDLQNDQYDYTFLKTLTDESIEKLVDVFVLVVGDSKYQISKSWEKALNFADRACKEIELMNRVCLDVSSKLPCFCKIFFETGEYLKETQDKLLKGKLTFCAFNDLAIFNRGVLESEKNLLQSCKDIEQFLSISSFWKSIESFFSHQITDILETKQKQTTGELTNEIKTQILLGFLSTFCVSNFKMKIESLVSEDIPISQLFHMLWQKEMTIKKLSLELSQIIKTLGQTEFPEERKIVIIRCLGLNLNSKKIAALRKFQSIVCSKLDDKCLKQMELFEEIQKNHAESECTMLQTNSLIKDLESAVLNFSEEVMGVIIEYSNSKNLISFLKDIMKEDIRNLMDAVEEEYFDQYLTLVSHLIEVKELLLPILQLPVGTDTIVYTSQIEKSLQKTKIQKATVKISECSKELESLKNFYKAFSNKTEKTKHRIKNILKNGRFYFNLCENECKVEILCTDDKKYSVSDISDLRSRALLIQNRFKSLMPIDSIDKTKNLSIFLKKVDAATQILETYQQLKMLGHPSYEFVDHCLELDDLEETKASLFKICNDWRDDLEEYRQKYSCLKYIKSEQLHLLFDYTKRLCTKRDQSSKESDIRSILWYLHPDLSFPLKENCFINECDSPRHMLDIVVVCLEERFKELELIGKSFPSFCKAGSPHLKFSKSCSFIRVDKDSESGPSLILGWFHMRCNKLPLPSQVVVCSENTSWDELYLLLLRSRERINASDECFCIAFLELLPVEYQGMLIDEIKKSDEGNSSLGLIYRGHPTDSIPTLFKEFEIFIQPFDRTMLVKLLQTMFPDVVVFTSESPGLGKTETIRDLAASREKGVRSLYLSGAHQKSQLIQSLKKLNLKPYEILHIVIGLDNKPKELDMLLFELVILRYVSFSSLSYVLPETAIALEITNCPNQMMTCGMPFSMCFSRTHLKWENYDNYKCQKEPHSPVQVTCAYLNELEKGELNVDVDLSQTALLNEEKCKDLLRKYFPSFDGINFTIVNIFLSVLGNQLKKFSASTYFQNKNLSLMIGEDNIFAVKKTILESLVRFSKEFASRSIVSCREVQHNTFQNLHNSSVDLKKTVTDLAKRTKGMIRWEHSNHLVFVFHSQNTQTMSAVYRCLENVPENIKYMFESQIENKLPDYTKMESDILLEILVKITRTKQKPLSKDNKSKLTKGYAYTPDNMLKMMMIALRLQSNIPVVVMGETGCGKTSLIRRLADICEVHLTVLSVHAGISKNDILDTVQSADEIASENRAEEVWLFFDELNTSEYVGLISDIVCHREIHGDALSPNLLFIAACNPYRLRDSKRYTKGLKGKLSEDALSLLAYRVHPLPEMMLDFVWDYGSLPLAEERAYIQRMVDTEIFKPYEKELIKLLGVSQQFVREKEGSSCIVSLRDVYRCISLIKWFKNNFIPKQHSDIEEKEVILRSFIMGLTICYMCRFSKHDDRKAYRERLSAVFSAKFIDTYSEREIAECIREEYNAILDKMDIPKGTARNTALQENIFVMLVCILNKLPLFIVGKPGCSKSLSMQLIRNNMRGKESKDPFFQNYPRLFYSSFQGSESSTSDGIMKVFERAKKIEIEHQNQENKVLSMVIIDEIGLAEISRFNPLKVLHSLLEPDGEDQLNVAVVGISNWALDSAKMNRAIHLSRPDLNEEELFITGQSIMESVAGHQNLEIIPKDFAKAYLEYIDKQPIKHFHGLRDYYSFVKCVSREFVDMDHRVCEVDNIEKKRKLLLKGLLRNFGGQQIHNETMRRTFFQIMSLNDLPICETQELIVENIVDSEARHLMLILDGDSALGSIEHIVENIGKEFTTILGSRFQDDEDDDYNYRVLNRIILCMEQPQVLILKDLDDIYGSLYDMLNQNYTIVQGKKHCRVALGPFSNPTCEVNDEFKCIVIIDEFNVENTDPPFLNRFEKQLYLLKDILKPRNERLAGYIEDFVHDFSSYSEENILFGAQDSFPIAGKELFISLVNYVERKLDKMYEKSTSDNQVLYYCIIELLWIFKPDCILRADISKACAKSRNSVEYLITMYMNLPIHNGLGYYLKDICDAEEHTSFVHEDVSKRNEHICNQLPFELKELMDIYFSKFKNDESVCNNSQDHWEEYEQNDLNRKENLDSFDHSSDVYLEKNVNEPNQNRYLRKENEHNKMKILRKWDDFGLKLIVFTYSTIYCKIREALNELDFSLHKLSEYKTEKTFTTDIETFFTTSQKKWLVLQCDIKSDFHHILLAKSIVEHNRKRLKKNKGTKHVCILVHITRSTNPFHLFAKINLSTGWTLATLDSIENPIFSIPDLYNKSPLDVLGANEQEFGELVVRELPWASAKIQYQGTSNYLADELKLKTSKGAVHFFTEQIQSWIKRYSSLKNNLDWHQRSACDKHLLDTSTTMIATLESHLSSLIQNPLARILYSVENAGLILCLLSFDELKPELKDIFHRGCECQNFYNIDAVPPPAGPGCYVINLQNIKMRVPFSKLIFENLEKYKPEVLEDVRRTNIIPGHFQVAEDKELKEAMLAIVRVYSDLIKKETQLFDTLTFDHIVEDLRMDFCQYATSTIKCRLSTKEKTDLIKWILNRLIGKVVIYDASTFLMTLNLWTWTYFQNIIGIFHLVDFWKPHAKNDDALYNLLYGSENDTSMLKSLQNFVDLICEDILSQCVQLKYSEMKEWQEGVYKFMTIMGDIGVISHKIETLKFFNDFVSVVFIPTECDYSHLNQFATCVSNFNWDLNKLNVFESLLVNLESLSESERVVEIQQVVCSFIAKCNGVNVDESEQKHVNLKAIRLIENGEMSDKCLRFYGHCLKLSLFDYFPDEDEDLESNQFLQMLEQEDQEFDEYLCAIHQVLSKQNETTFHALFVFSIQEELFCDVIGIENLKKIARHNDFLLRKLFQAKDALSNQCNGMRFSVAVAYLRTFLLNTAMLMLTTCYRNDYVLSAIDKLLCNGRISKEQKQLQKYFLDCFIRGSGELDLFKLSIELSDTMKFFKSNTFLPSVYNIGCSLESFNLARYCKLPDILLLEHLKDISEDMAFLKRLIKREKTSIASLLCFLHSRVFYVECFSIVSDADRLFVESLKRAGVCQKIDPVQQLIHHIVNQNDCKRNILKHGVHKTAESTSLTTFLLHVISLILIHENKSSTLYKAAIYCEVSECKPTKIETFTAFQIRTCTCGHRIISPKQSCPWCSSGDISGHTVDVLQLEKREPFSVIVRNILIEAALVTTCLFQDVVNEIGLKEVESRERSIQMNWQKLREHLQVNDSEQCQLLIIFLERVKEIFSDSAISYSNWNEKYDEELRNVLQDRYQQLRMDNIKHNEMCKAFRTAIANENGEDKEYVEENILFCQTVNPCIQNLYFELRISKSEEKFPCLNMILENLEVLKFPQYIEGILQWHKLLVTRCSYSLKKVDCKYMSVGTFIDKQDNEIQRELRDKFKTFADKWADIVNFFERLEHHTSKLPCIEIIREDSKIGLCVMKDKTSTVFQIINALCLLQNKILDKVLEICVLCESRALGFLHIGPKKAAIPVVPLMDLQTKHIVKSLVGEKSEKLELFSQVGCTAGTRGYDYDFRKLEIEWAYKLFHNRAYILIDETMMFMEFKDDLYGHCVQLLHKVDALIPQTTIDSTLKKKIKKMLQEDPSQGPQLLTLVGTITTVIVRGKITEGRQHLAEFAGKLEGLQLIRLSSNCLLPFTEYELTLNKVVAFYTLLEEINGKIHFDALDNDFRDAIKERTIQQITAVVGGNINLLRACESAMHMFLHRYLYVRDNDISIQQPIADYLSSPELWKDALISGQQITLPNFDNEILLQDVFPHELLVKHVYKFLEFLKEQIKLFQMNTRMPKLPQGSRKNNRRKEKTGIF